MVSSSLVKNSNPVEFLGRQTVMTWMELNQNSYNLFSNSDISFYIDNVGFGLWTCMSCYTDSNYQPLPSCETEVFTAVMIQVEVFWVVTVCSVMVRYHHFKSHTSTTTSLPHSGSTESSTNRWSIAMGAPYCCLWLATSWRTLRRWHLAEQPTSLFAGSSTSMTHSWSGLMDQKGWMISSTASTTYIPTSNSSWRMSQMIDHLGHWRIQKTG